MRLYDTCEGWELHYPLVGGGDKWGRGPRGASNSYVHPSPNRHAIVGVFIRAIACIISPSSHAASGAYFIHVSIPCPPYYRVLTFPHILENRGGSTGIFILTGLHGFSLIQMLWLSGTTRK